VGGILSDDCAMCWIKYSCAAALWLVLCVTSNNICKPVALLVELMITNKIQNHDDCINTGYDINQTTALE
jgi:hypothetical protein